MSIPQIRGSNCQPTQSLDLFAEQIAQYPDVEVIENDIPATRDRWVLSSNLQKAIRLALPDTAVATAKTLLEIDERYFFRRLLVIAYEDIGIANPAACFFVIRLFRRAAMHRRLGPLRVAAWLIHQLCWSVKSRSLCDGIVAVDFSARKAEYEQQLANLSADQVLDIATSRDENPVARIAATRELAGYSVFVGGAYRVVRPQSKQYLTELATRLCLTDMETRLLLSGQGVTESINIPLPICLDMLRCGPSQVVRNERRFHIRNGILTSALDRHTRMGQAAFERFARESRPIGRFLQARSRKNVISALGCAAFILDGAQLDRELQFEGSAALRQAADEAFLEYSGMPGGMGRELLALVSENLSELDAIRWEMLA
ncbi:hypothetical protein RVV18_003841 [Burkholderia ambifaria]|nr:hypothetical protein [Burkholderia ambifaria]